VLFQKTTTLRTRRRALFLGLATSIAATVSLVAQASLPPPLTLEEAVQEALANNLGLRIERLNPINADDNVAIEEAAFDPVLSAGLGHSEGEQSVLRTTSDSRSYSAGVRKRLAMTNATVSATTSWSRNDGTRFDQELNLIVGGGLSERAAISVGIDQPLLRDFGNDIATAGLERARADQRAARYQLQDATLGLLSELERRYWGLAEANARLELRRTNFALAQRLLDEISERAELGLATQLDVIQAEANLAQRDEDILLAQQTVDDAKDALLSILGRMNDGLALTTDLVIEALPPVAPETPELAAVWREALESDFAQRRQEEIIAQREIDRTLARNNRKPTLDLNVSATLSGLSGESGYDALERAVDADGEDWNVRFSFVYPLGQRAANASLRQAERRLSQAEIQLIELKQELLQEVRTTWRELDTRKKRLRAAELVLELQEQTFAQERSRLDEGLSTLRDVLEIQRDLDDARLGLLSARAAAIQAEVRLERLRGTLLQRHGLTWAQVAPSILN
jgi:outer membrane protein